MDIQHSRALSLLSATLAALALAAAPALASEEGQGGDEAPALIRPATPTQARTAGLQTPVAARRAGARSTVPRGGVAAGAGGMAPGDSNGVLLGFAGGALVLVTAGGGLIIVGRRTGA
jgi:hypothetical protein